MLFQESTFGNSGKKFVANNILQICSQDLQHAHDQEESSDHSNPTS